MADPHFPKFDRTEEPTDPIGRETDAELFDRWAIDWQQRLAAEAGVTGMAGPVSR
jgi:hypothetical protein